MTGKGTDAGFADGPAHACIPRFQLPRRVRRGDGPQEAEVGVDGIARGPQAGRAGRVPFLDDREDHVLLAGEVPVDQPGGQTGLLDDVLHRRAVETVAGEAAGGGVEDLPTPTVRKALRADLGHLPDHRPRDPVELRGGLVPAVAGGRFLRRQVALQVQTAFGQVTGHVGGVEAERPRLAGLFDLPVPSGVGAERRTVDVSEDDRAAGGDDRGQVAESRVDGLRGEVVRDALPDDRRAPGREAVEGYGEASGVQIDGDVVDVAAGRRCAAA